jgi:hypothetical protein
MADTTEQQILGTPDVADLSRQRKLAELLMGQGMQQPQGQMISGYYVAPSFAQQLNPIANILAGQAVGERADTQQVKMAEALRGKQAMEIEKFGELEAKDKPAALRYALSTDNPVLRDIAKEELKGIKLGKGDIFTRTSLGGGTTKLEGAPDLPDVIQYAISVGGLPANPATWNEQQRGFAKNLIESKAKAGASSLTMPSEGERKAGFMANILDRNILQMQTALGVDPSAVKPNVPASVVEAIAGPNLLSRTMKPEQRQIIEDSQLDVLDAALTLRTGAAYTREQLNAMRDTYFPVLGDKPKAVNAKKQRLETLLEGAYIASGRATPARVSAPYTPPPAQPNVNQQLNIPAAPQAPKFLGFEQAPTGQR